MDSIEVNIPTDGFYKISFLSRYSIDAGEEQLNESYYVFVRQASSGLVSYPIDANLTESTVDSVDANGDSISYKIVLDDNTLTTESVLRHAGVFFLRNGLHVIEINHYAVIADQFPQFINIYPDSAFSDPCFEGLTPPVVSGHLGGKYNAESIELDSLAIEQVGCKAYDISSQKIASKDSVFTEGDTLSYTISVANLGPDSALNITVTDTLPPFVTAFDFNPPPDKFENNILEWRLAFLANDSTTSLTYKSSINVTPTDTSLMLVNRTRVASANDTSASNDTAEATIIARPRPESPVQKNYDVSVSKFADRDSVFTTNDTLCYSLTVSNLGPNTAFNITVTDTLPPFSTALDFDPPPNKFENNVLEWQLAFLDNDSTALFSYNSLINVTPTDTSLMLVNRTRVVSANDTSASNNTAEATIIARPKPEPPVQNNVDVSVSKFADRDSVFTTNDAIRYSLTISNLGPNTAFNITVSDTLPPFVNAFDFSLSPSRIADNVVEWQIDSLEAGTSVGITFTARVNISPPDTTIALVNRAYVSAANDTLATNNFGQATVIAVPKPAIEHKYDLTLTKTASMDFVSALDSSFVYSLVIINTGPMTAHQISLQDTLPPFISASGFSHSPSRIENNLIEWQLDSLEIDRAVQVSFTATVNLAAMNESMQLVNRSRVFAPNDSILTNNIAQVAVVASPDLLNYDLAFIKTANKDSAFTESDTLEYVLTVRNSGPNEATTVTVSDTLPQFVNAFDFSPQPNRIENNVLEWQLNTLAANRTAFISYSVSVQVDPADTTLALTNRGGVSALNDTVLANNFSTATVIAIKRPRIFYALEISKTANADTVGSGENFSYTISVTNSGTGFISGYTVRDILPSQLNPSTISNYFPKPPNEINGNILSWTFDALAVGATQLIIFDVTGVALTAPGTADILNVVEVTGPNNIPVASSRDSAVVAIVTRPAVECYLDRNIWKPDEEPPLGINFSLTTGSTVRIRIHDLAGTLIRDLLDQPYDAGQQRVEWDGRTENGLQVGSGLYVVTFESQQFIDWKKVIIVR